MANGLHIKVSFNAANGHTTKYYLVDDKTQAKLWAVAKRSSASDLDQWLAGNGGKLDREKEPAVVEYYRDSDGLHCREAWYSNGQRHREGGPAVVKTCTDGSRYEAWFKHDVDGPSHASHKLKIPGVSLILPKPPV